MHTQKKILHKSYSVIPVQNRDRDREKKNSWNLINIRPISIKVNHLQKKNEKKKCDVQVNNGK